MRILILSSLLALSFFNSLSAEINQVSDSKDIVERFMLPNSELIKPDEPLSSKPIQEYDFDKDGQNEIIAVYKKKDTQNHLKAMVLKKVRGKWKKIWEIPGKGFDVERMTITDITGDGTDDLLIGWMIGASAGNELEVFQWQGQTLKKIAELAYYHKLELLIRDNQTYLAVWQRYCCDTYLVDVLRWDGKKFMLDEEAYSEYYPIIKKFYEGKIREMDAWFYWYSLADAQIKANLMEEAETSIQKGISFNQQNQLFEELQKRIEQKEK
ncbi:VCBS repeat-containing protein [Peribacillus saganii]|uniref:VCBS repeat-containing protein n=1 Tax=Peribacillus saganii TaxID=2303992 RepID=A0A372LS85_9BACI|nr:VCBS repeat-containing protein [Peribacillus saganii]RFU71048.1 VCBS repeat-containing protein [Peribacillus saganii]